MATSSMHASRTAPTTWADIRAELKSHGAILGGTVLVLWAVFALDTLTGGLLHGLGVRPRSIQGLRGLLFAPFLHGSLMHIVSNTLPLVVMGWMVLLRDTRSFFRVTAAGFLYGGMTAWLLGASHSSHIGASGVVFAYFGYLLLGGWFDRRFLNILVSLGVAALWGGLVFGVLPGQPGISWECHLGGFVGGALSARAAARRSARA
jgi:membrane associated rhomboid family serine protease